VNSRGPAVPWAEVDPERWSRLQELFHAASALPPEGRAAYLGEACPDDPEIQREVLALLAGQADAPDQLADEVRRAAVALASEIERPLRIGPYAVLRELGQGGMGVVYLAERDDRAYRMRVAIKVARGPVSRSGEARLVSERQILATLEHPNVARLLDGGTTESGLPYLVMEYVEGEPIDVYCDRRLLATEARLRLFRVVCDAVQHAHQSLIVHRDLKPANILVTASGEVKLLDFGIAKLLKPELFPQAAPPTATALRPMTLDYASPEQVRGDPVTTASDVYSLGVVLYELLTGHRPFETQDRRPQDLERLITGTEPQKPSAVVTRPLQRAAAHGGEGTRLEPEEVSRARGTQPEKLRRRLRGDLDNIVLMAISKTPARRYPSAFQLSEDIRRFLAGEPVLARRPTWGYRAGKFVRRHRLALAGASLSFALVLAFGVSRARLAADLARERDQARKQAEAAHRVAGFLQDIFRVADPGAARGDTLTARELLDRGAARVSLELRNEPEVQATLLDTIGNVYRHLGLYEHAVPLLEEALATRSRVLGEDDLDTAVSLEDLGELQQERGLYPAAEGLLRRAAIARERLLGPNAPEVARSLTELGRVLGQEGRYAEAEGVCRRALAIREARSDDPAALAGSLEGLAEVLQDEGRAAEAEPLAKRATATVRHVGGGDALGLARALGLLGRIERDRGDLDGAEAASREALETRRRLLGRDHPTVGLSLTDLAGVLLEKGDPAAAERLYREALSVLVPGFGDGHPSVAAARQGLARALLRTGALGRAEAACQQALAARRESLGEDNPATLSSLRLLGRIRAAQGRTTEAEAIYRDVLERRRRALPPGHPQIADSLLDLGWLLDRRGDAKAAEPLLREAVAVRRRSLPEGDWRTAEAESSLGGCLLALGRPAEAETLLQSSLPILEARRGLAGPEARDALRRAVRLYEAARRAEAAATPRRP
jgi:serine/threonine protein kinase/tetratricopeptide (TPR) repeat protein